MKYKVLVIEAAELDLLDIHLFVEQNDSPDRADKLLNGIEQTVAGLDKMPEQGHVPPKLERTGIHDYREVHFKPYRIIYEITAKTVIVHAIFDSRRDLRDLLQERLLR